MFGLPNFNLDEMAKMVADFQVRHERMVTAMLRIEANQKLIMEHLKIDFDSRYGQPDEAIEHDNSN